MVVSKFLKLLAFSNLVLITHASSATLNDSWYVMQAGSSPWGYFHEVIQFNDGRYFYRYDMTKRENAAVYNENIGAVAEQNLTPVAFNLNKSGGDTSQSYSGTYKLGDNAGVFTVQYKGAIEKTYKRNVAKNTILEVFFPVWIKDHWNELKPGYRSSISIFTEDPETTDYRSKTARFEISKERSAGSQACKEIKVELDNRKSVWCVTKNAALVDMIVGNNEVQVRRVENEKAAKSFLGIR